MKEFFGERCLSHYDHPDIFGMAQAGMTIDDIASYAARPKGEVALYLLRHLPQTYDELIRNERLREQKQ